MKIIFLDFDGPLVPFRKENLKCRPAKASDEAVVMLNLLVETSGAKIVVTSSWRIAKTVPDLAKILGAWGVIGEVFDKTPSSPDRRRGTEIWEWLIGRNDVESFVIIDDESEGMEPFKSAVVKPDRMVGMLWDDVVAAVQVLEAS